MQNFCIIRLGCRISASSIWDAEFLHHQVGMQNFCMFFTTVQNLSILLINTVNYFTSDFHRVLGHCRISALWEASWNAEFLHHSLAVRTAVDKAERTCRISASDKFVELHFKIYVGIRMQNLCISSWLLYVLGTKFYLRLSCRNSALSGSW